MADERFQPDGQLIDVWNIRRGSSFKKKYTWRAGVGSPKNVGGISAAVSAVVTVPGHTFTVGTEVVLRDVVGTMASKVNGTLHTVSAVAGDTVTLPLLNTVGLAYTSGGTLQAVAPVNLTGWTGRSQIRAPDGTVLLTPVVTLGGAEGTIEATLAHTLTAPIAETIKKGTFDLELENGDASYVKNFVGGAVVVLGEVTK